MENRISILIRTFNSEKTLGQVLCGIHLQEGDEFLVVDSGSTDSTLKIAGEYGAKILHAPKPFNYSKSLNIGFNAAVNPWVLVLSSHCVPIVPSFLEILRSEAAGLPQEVLVGYCPSTISGKSDPQLDPENTSIFAPGDYTRVRQVCGNGNTIYRKTAWEKLPFDETKKTAEDKLWIQEMVQRGYRFAYIPRARGINKNQASLKYMFWKGYRDERALPQHKPMSIYCLGGALKKIAMQKVSGEIDWGNWLRYSAHIMGEFFGSYRSSDNTSNNGAS
ncbi:MAG: glycosyltransferase family 2 protein [Chthoniobacteraceae bacterium]